MSNNTKDTIFIGKKPLMTYVTSTIIQLATIPLIKIKARRLSMAHAVDVAQIALQRTNPAFVIGDVKIDSESLVSRW
jgi:DNA-binding protein